MTQGWPERHRRSLMVLFRILAASWPVTLLSRDPSSPLGVLTSWMRFKNVGLRTAIVQADDVTGDSHQASESGLT